ncbi:MAG: histidine kinase, partial [Bacteroidales bacterium]|nr:histidine kinase [Bacteroidales bacterium]
WFATLHNGVYYLPDLSIRYYDKSNFLYRNNVNTVYTQKDSLWIGYHANYVSVLSKNVVKHIKISENKDIEVSAIVYDKKKKRLLIGTQKGLYLIKNGQSERYINKRQSSKYSNILSTKDIAADQKEGYWIAGRLGFYYIKDRKILFDSKVDKNFSLRNNAIYVDDGNSVWIGSIKGLWRFKNNYLEYMGHQNPLLSIRVLDIIKYQNKLTLGTKGGGIIIIDKDTIFQINTVKGLNSNTITSLSVSGKYLWAGTKKGLSRIFVDKKHTIKIFNYTKAHGLLTNEIRHIYAKDTFLYISSNKGLMRLNINQLKKDTLKIPIYFKGIFINNKKVPIQKEYKLKYNQNNILIQFEAVSFNNADELEFRYMMSGLDSICSSTKSKELRFSFLPPGKYTFELSARNRDNVWNKQSEKITFIIEKPFWKTNWFTFSLIFTGFILIYLFFRYKTYQINKKNEMQRELNIYIKQALVNHMNPHFMFNSLGRINNLILNNDKAKASEYLSKFSRLMRIIIENSKREYIPIYEEIKASRMYMEIEASRLEHGLDYEFIIDDEIDQFNTKVPSLLIQPFIENAIWYGIQPMNKRGKIVIRIRKKDKYLSIEIQDNGIGRKKSIEMIKNNEVFNNQSKGTEIRFKRIRLLEQIFGRNTKIEYLDLEGTKSGTVVILNLPIIK